MSSKHTPGPWAYQEDSDAYTHIVRGPNNRFICQLAQVTSAEIEANARLIAAAPELLAELKRAQDFIDGIRQELHHRRVADWYPEAAHNAAEQMSEDMRLLGNACADFDLSAAIAKATGEA